jgi:protein-tyrosine phosphatase
MPIKILMVCLGNICRSPLAQGILESKLQSDDFTVDSAGTAAYHLGELPDPRSIAVARKYGIDITNQRARKFSKQDFDEFDYIYTMDSENYANIITQANSETEINKVKLILNELQPNANKSVPDPYYGGDDGFGNVYNMLDEACSVIATKLTR